MARTIDLTPLNAVARQVQEMQRTLPPAAMRDIMNQTASAARAVMPIAGAMQQVQRTLDGCSSAVGGTLASVAKMWPSISWPKLSGLELKTISDSVAQISELSEAYRQQRQRSLEGLALLPVTRPRPRSVFSTEAQLVQQLDRLGRKIQKLERRLAEPESPPNALTTCRIMVDAKRQVAIITRGRRRIMFSLERAESRVLSRLITSASSERTKRSQPTARKGWVSSKRLVRLLTTRSGSQADAAAYLRKTISELRRKIAEALRPLDRAADRLDVIQYKRHPTHKHGFYRLGLAVSKATVNR